MFRAIFLLVIGIVVGYFIGFGDAQTHEQHIVQRLVGKTGGAARSNVSNDIDSKLEKAGR